MYVIDGGAGIFVFCISKNAIEVDVENYGAKQTCANANSQLLNGFSVKDGDRMVLV